MLADPRHPVSVLAVLFVSQPVMQGEEDPSSLDT